MESDICDLDKKIADEHVFLKQKELALRYSEDNVEEARRRWSDQDKNYKFMRKHDVVEINEYRETRRLLATAREDYNENLAKNSELRAGAAHHRRIIEEATEKRDRLKGILAEFGQVLQFKQRAA